MTEGPILIVSGPSGVGKSTLLSRLPADRFYVAVSHTTRPPREGEVHGRNYYFVDEGTFLDMVAREEFLEWVKVHSHYYGTSKGEVERAERLGKNLVFDVEVIGAGKLKAYFGDRAVSIFIVPPDLETLRERLLFRGTEGEEKRRERLERAKFELSFAGFYDYVIVNDDLDEAVRSLLAIVEAEICRPFRRLKILQKLYR